MSEVKESPFGHGFADVIERYSWEGTTDAIASATLADARRVLARAKVGVTLSPDEFAILISPAAAPLLEEMAQLSQQITRRRFGLTMSMYIPMYVSNACTNKCVYCGFNHDNKFERTTLSLDDVRQECEAIKELGPFENLLVVSGEYPALCGVDYLEQVLRVARPMFANLTLEVQPLKTEQYKQLVGAGLNGVVCFQETYHREAYKKYHPRGMKSHYAWRLNGFDRMGQAGVHSIGMGVLIGLEEWRTDVTMMAYHLRYLQKKYWKTKYSVNFPRMRPAENGGFQPNVIMNDRELAQLTFAMRIFDHDVDISYSTREPAQIRDNMAGLGVTTMSAESKTEPGGYYTYPQALEQFHVSDERTAVEVEHALKSLGREPVWKDWDVSFDKFTPIR